MIIYQVRMFWPDDIVSLLRKLSDLIGGVRSKQTSQPCVKVDLCCIVNLQAAKKVLQIALITSPHIFPESKITTRNICIKSVKCHSLAVQCVHCVFQLWRDSSCLIFNSFCALFYSSASWYLESWNQRWACNKFFISMTKFFCSTWQRDKQTHFGLITLSPYCESCHYN